LTGFWAGAELPRSTTGDIGGDMGSAGMVGVLGNLPCLSAAKVSTPLASSYGPARVTVGDVRVNGKTVPESYSAGWVFLVPKAEVGQQAAAAAAPSE